MDLLGLPVSFDPADAWQVVRRITVFELLSLVGIVIAVVSLILSMRATVDQAKTRAAEFSFRVWERFRADDVQSAFLDIEWGRFQYPVSSPANNGFETPDQEHRIDRLLSLMDDIAALAKRRVLRRHDAERWAYVFVRVFDDAAVQRYMSFLSEFYARNGITLGPHLMAGDWYKRIKRAE